MSTGAGQVLSFAAVASHGREWRTRVALRAFILAAAVTPALAQAPAGTGPWVVTGRRPSISLAIRTLIATRAPILDVAETAEHLIVLEPDAIARYARADALDGAAPSASAPVTHTGPWPRDLRGRLRLTAAGFEAFLPGVTCRGTVQPFAATCADEPAAWPLGLDNSGIAPTRNSFTTPEGLVFYGAAALGPSGDASAGWLVADSGGTLAFLDASRSVVARADEADDVARLAETCTGGAFVLATTRSPHAPLRDDLRLLRVAGTTLTTVASINLPGAVTALWAPQRARAATVVVHESGSSRYEAHQISIACAR
jgi:hypothetical protein